VPLVMNEGILNSTLTQFKSTMWHIEIGIDLMIDPFKHRLIGLQPFFQLLQPRSAGFEFKIDMHAVK